MAGGVVNLTLKLMTRWSFCASENKESLCDRSYDFKSPGNERKEVIVRSYSKGL